jgi:hypothetical protein
MSDEGVTLITCTGGRPEAFALCVKHVMQQTYRNPMQWVIADDAWPRTPVPHNALSREHGIDVEHLFPQPVWKPGQNTLARNLLAAIPHVLHCKVLFIEDDDFYAPEYVSEMVAALDRASIVGEIRARYYHVPSRRYRLLDNAHHASLCQTGIRSEWLPILQNVCEEERQGFIDVRLWERCAGLGLKRALISFVRPLCVGIKGLPGRPGIGIGHRPETGDGWVPDSDLTKLREWIGPAADLYYPASVSYASSA